MHAFRIAKSKYIEDLSGEGARLYGGRWNRKGTPVVYLAENRALAAVEYLVHIPLLLLPSDLCIAEIALPDTVDVTHVPTETLTANWSEYPPPSSLKEIGEEWVRNGLSLLLRVPSAVIRGEHNVLMNPRHEHAKLVSIISIEPFEFDERLRKNAP